MLVSWVGAGEVFVPDTVNIACEILTVFSKPKQTTFDSNSEATQAQK